MNRYDEEEKQEAYVKSPEYAAEQAALAQQKKEQEEAKTAELQDTIAEMDLEKALTAQEERGHSLA